MACDGYHAVTKPLADSFAEPERRERFTAEEWENARIRRRFGTFLVNVSLWDHVMPSVRRILSETLPVRAEHLFHNNCIEYLALSPHFYPCSNGMKAPQYEAIYDQDKDHVSFRRMIPDMVPL
jgi:hypothetical protein